ncbi:hypothetical protein EIN_328060 [Entamoeba invadens IP1]|uniref:Protein NO VEIN C-terminal domain-containing protein n=1 Tax=Entamoeba invadens IP1 TaxID=370355 RepID=A0A0A1TXQ9_ENTIV|nr:hypothetical protein EIN_328060 [Entamoeba invadens IP1]ELP86149.1 hypothetical protein EIN_328060 [Entamoeba invadens IP1]|eukprot:XP_004185495.1 hypothetical protein EIN_328060 [Entamoeba invadens IP1]
MSSDPTNIQNISQLTDQIKESPSPQIPNPQPSSPQLEETKKSQAKTEKQKEKKSNKTEKKRETKGSQRQSAPRVGEPYDTHNFCQICQDFEKMTHAFHTIIPKPTTFWRTLLGQQVLKKDNIIIGNIMRLNVLVIAFVLGGEKKTRIEIKTAQEKLILEQLCLKYCIFITLFVDNTATLEKTIMFKKIIRLTTRDVKEMVTLCSKARENNPISTTLAPQKQEEQKESDIGIYIIMDLVKKKIKEFNISSFGEFLIYYQVIEKAICKELNVSNFKALKHEEFLCFCGKYVDFPFEVKKRSKIIGLDQIVRVNVLSLEAPFSVITKLIKNARYLVNLFNIKELRKVDIESIVEKNDFEDCQFMEISKHNIIKVPVYDGSKIQNQVEEHIEDFNFLAGMLVAHLFNEESCNGETISNYVKTIVELSSCRVQVMTSEVSRATLAINILNEFPEELIGVEGLVSFFLEALGIEMNALVALSLNNTLFLRPEIREMISACFPEAASLPDNVMQFINAHQHETENTIPLPKEIVIDMYERNGEQVQVVDFEDPEFITILKNASENNDLDKLQSILAYMCQNPVVFAETFRRKEVVNGKSTELKQYSSFYHNLKNLRWFPTTQRTIEYHDHVFNQKELKCLQLLTTPFIVPAPLSHYLATALPLSPIEVAYILHSKITKITDEYVDLLSFIPTMDGEVYNKYIELPIILVEKMHDCFLTSIEQHSQCGCNETIKWVSPQNVFLRDPSSFFPTICTNKTRRNAFLGVGVKPQPSVLDYIRALVLIGNSNQTTDQKKLTILKKVMKEIVLQFNTLTITPLMINPIRSLKVLVNDLGEFSSLDDTMFYNDISYLNKDLPCEIKRHLFTLDIQSSYNMNAFLDSVSIQKASSVMTFIIDEQYEVDYSLTEIIRQVLSEVLPLLTEGKTRTLVSNYQKTAQNITVVTHNSLLVNLNFSFYSCSSPISSHLTAVMIGNNLHVLKRTGISSFDSLCFLSRLFFGCVDESFIGMMLSKLSVKSPIQVPMVERVEGISAEKEEVDWELINTGKENAVEIFDDEFAVNVNPYQYTKDKELAIQTGFGGEEFVYQLLKETYHDRVEWINGKDSNGESTELGMPFDIVLKDEHQNILSYIEVKTTVMRSTPIKISYREWLFAQEKRKKFCIYRVQCFGSNKLYVNVIVDPIGKWMKGEVEIKINFL